jgi:hypothetical protein
VPKKEKLEGPNWDLMTTSFSSGLKEIQASFKVFKESQRSTEKLVEEIARKRNELSYVTADQIENVFGSSLVSASKFSLALDNEVYEIKKKIEKCQLDTADSIEQIQESINQLQGHVSTEGFPIELSFLCELLDSMQQQSAVEVLVVEKVTNFNDASLDQDMLVTLIAAFKYSPYLRQSDVDLVLDTKMKWSHRYISIPASVVTPYEVVRFTRGKTTMEMLMIVELVAEQQQQRPHMDMDEYHSIGRQEIVMKNDDAACFDMMVHDHKLDKKNRSYRFSLALRNG